MHLQLAWIYLTESRGSKEAAGKMRRALQRFATTAGHPEKYHETITQFWLRLLARKHAENPGATLEQILQRDPRLLEKSLPFAYYSSSCLESEAARAAWLEPDLQPLTADAAPICPPDSTRHASHRALS